MSYKLNIYILLTLLLIIIGFHLLVIMGIVPYQIVWGGRLNSQEEMIRFESVSLAINALMVGIVAVKAGVLKISIPGKIIHGLIWVMAGLFALNTVGNLMSTNTFEKLVFTPMTLILAFLCVRLVWVKPS